MKTDLMIEILPNYFLKEDGSFNLEEALNMCGRIAGVCYSKEGFKALATEPIESTKKRIDLTLSMGHHSVYDHININFNFKNLPRLMESVLHNEKQYTSSTKSGRYTNVVAKKSSCISEKEVELYNKWLKIFSDVIKEKYGNFFNDSKILKLAQENSRLLISIFMPTEMVYTTTLRQINNIVSWMKIYIKDAKDELSKKISDYFEDFIEILESKNILVPQLQENEKNRKFSLFSEVKRKEYFGDVYSTNYKVNFAIFLQLQRHRTLRYEAKIISPLKFYVPPVLDSKLKKEWLSDLRSLEHLYPQALMLEVNESGSYEDFILKAKERLCTHAQVGAQEQTKQTLLKYSEELEKSGHRLKKNIIKYTKGARCTFPDYKCKASCGFKEGILLKRKV